MENFNRQYRVRIGPSGASGREIGAADEETGRCIRCSFSCEVGDSSSSNTGKITLWNLSDETLNLLEQEDCAIELDAGYGDDMPTIMGGTLTYCVTSPSGADQQTEIEFVDGFSSMRDCTISLSYEGTVNGKKIVQDAASQMGCEIKFSPSVSFSDYKDFAWVGDGPNLIGKICTHSKLRWSVQNGIIQVCALNEPITTAAYLLSAETGMIGSPVPVFESASTSDQSGGNSTKRKSKTGIEVEYFLNGHIQVDDCVRIESKRYTGTYRAKKISFNGDTEGGDWTCKGTFVEVS